MTKQQLISIEIAQTHILALLTYVQNILNFKFALLGYKIATLNRQILQPFSIK